MLSDAGSMPCLAPKLQWPALWGSNRSLLWCKPNLQSACSSAEGRRGGGGRDYNLYGTEHCLQVSLFNEKQNNPSGTQSTILWALGGKRAFHSFISENTTNYSTGSIFLSYKVNGFLETTFLFGWFFVIDNTSAWPFAEDFCPSCFHIYICVVTGLLQQV